MLNGFVFVEMANQILSINNARLETFLAILKNLYLKTTLYLPICAHRLHIWVPKVLTTKIVTWLDYLYKIKGLFPIKKVNSPVAP